MGDIGIDKWYLKMQEHKRKHHHRIKYDELNPEFSTISNFRSMEDKNEANTYD